LFCAAVADDSCGVCPSCRKIAGGNHGDIHFIEPLPDKRDISIDQLREIQRELALRPYEAPRKACIIEPADRMSVNAANSLLKTLEEPPGNAIIILLTENADMLLPTVRSRCQLIRFSSLSPENVRLLLEKSGVAPDLAELLAPLSEGSMQRAGEHDNSSLIERREALLAHLTTLDLERIATIFDTAEELAGNRDETLESIDLLLSVARDAVYLKAGCSDIVNTTIRPALEAFAAGFSLERALQMLGDIVETRRAVQRNANNKLALECLFMKMAEAIA
jgi:DNA polymerase-3 subunit delta'